MPYQSYHDLTNVQDEYHAAKKLDGEANAAAQDLLARKDIDALKALKMSDLRQLTASVRRAALTCGDAVAADDALAAALQKHQADLDENETALAGEVADVRQAHEANQNQLRENATWYANATKALVAGYRGFAGPDGHAPQADEQDLWDINDLSDRGDDRAASEGHLDEIDEEMDGVLSDVV